MDNQQESIFFEYPKDNRYLVTRSGQVISTKRGSVKVLKPHLHKARGKKRYQRIKIAGKLELLHRVLAASMIGRCLTKDEQVNHINGDTLDNRIDNLEVVSFAENVKHAVENNLYCSGSAWHNSRR